MKVPPEALAPRAVCRWIMEASEALAAASKATDDATLRQSIEKARRALAPARKRAQLVLEHHGGATQDELPL